MSAQIVSEVAALMGSRIWPDQAAAMHAEFAACLRKAGFRVVMEFPTQSLGDCRNGRIDIVVNKGLSYCAIELDCRKPRRRSLQKLRLFEGARIVGVRGIERQPIPEGIDAVVTMRVRVPTDAEAADKRTINRSRA